MSAECQVHGCDLVYPFGSMKPVCQWCIYEAQIEELKAALREILLHVVFEDSESQAGIIARAALDRTQ